jgi:hypothetical protein
MNLDRIQLDSLQQYIATGKDLPAHFEQYLSILDMVRGLFVKYEKKSFIINTLTSPPYDVSRPTAERIYADAINFFYLDNNIRKEAWKNVYATRFEQAAQVAWEAGDMETFRRCMRDAAEARGIFKEDPPPLPPGIGDNRPIVYVMDPEKMGIPKVNRAKLGKFIDELDITNADKVRLKRDAQIEDIPFTILEENASADQ